MKIYPTMQLQDHRVVKLIGGDPQNVGAQPQLSAAEQANLWRRQGARRVHVVDLDAAFGLQNQWRTLGQVIAAGMKVQFGGGIRSMLDVQKLLDLGVDRVVVGTQGVQNPEWLRELAGLWPGKIVLALDGKKRTLVAEGWTKETGHDVVDFAKAVEGVDLGAILYTNIERDGQLSGIDAEIISELRQAAPGTELIVGGGIANMQDLAVLDGLGVDAVVLGMSLHADAIKLGDAVGRFEKLE